MAIPNDPERLLGSMEVNASFDAAYSKLVKQEPVTCSKSGIEYPAISSPDVAMLDVSLPYLRALCIFLNVHIFYTGICLHSLAERTQA